MDGGVWDGTTAALPWNLTPKKSMEKMGRVFTHPEKKYG